MKITKKIKGKVFPPSAKYFGEEMRFFRENVNKIKNEIDKNNETLNRIEEHLVRIEQKIDIFENETKRRFKIQDKKMRLYTTQLYRKNGESSHDAEIRLFNSLPNAQGFMALYQRANTKLLNMLIKILEENKLDYWFVYGSCIACRSRGGAIPWDDDVDISMTRLDFEKLKEIIEKEKDCMINIVYDAWGMNRQYRFCSTNLNLHNFIDITPCDPAVKPDWQMNKKYLELRDELEKEIKERPEFAYWREIGCLTTDGSRFLVEDIDETKLDEGRTRETIKLADEMFERYLEKARELGITCDFEKSESVVFALDNCIGNVNKKRMLFWDRRMIFPTKKMKYENLFVRVPNKVDDFCTLMYEGWPYISDDVCGDKTHFLNDNKKAETISALEAFLKN